MGNNRLCYQVRSIPAQLETQAAEQGGSPKIEGYFAVFDSSYDIDEEMSESIDPHAFDGELTRDIRALINHDDTLVLGRTQAGTLRLRVDAHGLWGSIDVNTNDTDAMNLYARVQRGDVSQCSFGFDIIDEDTEVRKGGGEIHWTIKKVRLYEVSPCTFPAYEATAIDARRRDRAAADSRRCAEWCKRMLKLLKGE